MDPHAEFIRLASAWKQDTELHSSPAVIASHAAYRGIVALGAKALPHILRDLARTHAPWFWALREITGEDPVPDGDRGDVERMTAAWVAWGRSQGHT